MYKIEKYGVTFIRLNPSLLETVRSWRNSENVRPFMQNQNVIAKKDQITWFKSINNDRNYYFVAHIKKDPIGLFNIKDIDHDNKVGECGSFLKSSEYWETKESMCFHFLLIHVAFELLGLKQVVCTILNTNKKTIALNLQIGYVKDEKNSDESISKYRLTYNSFLKSKGARLLKYIDK